MVPNNWNSSYLKDVVIFLDGKRKPIKSEDRSNMKGKYPYYGATGIIDWVNDYIFDDKLILMGEDGENILSRKLPHVFCISGKAWVNNHAHVFKAKSNIDSFYLSTYLESLDYRKYNSGSAQPKLNKAVCEKIPVLLPPLPEQRKIATILGTWDKAIRTTERLIDNSQQQKKALMQQLLTGKKRLLDDSSKPFEGEWEEIKLGDVCSKVTDGAHHSPKSVDNGYPMYSVKDMKPTGFAKNTARLISDADFLSLVKQNCKPEINDILIAKDGSILKYCFVVKEEVQGVILSSIALLRPKLSTIQPEFIAQYFSQESIKYFVGKALTSGSGVPRIILKDFKGIHLKIPTIAEQQKISLVLINADNEIELLEQQLADLKQEKKALMQQLLTGKRRVKIKSQECIA
jgi:type I restriction enzyme S subunit